jgi:hypothetical protein
MGRNVDRPENGENSPKIALQIWKAYAKIPSVKLTIGLKLKPTKEQPAALKETLGGANDAANECFHPPYNQDDHLDVDLGINRIATESAWQSFSGTDEASLCWKTFPAADRCQLSEAASSIYSRECGLGGVVITITEELRRNRNVFDDFRS